GSAVICLLGEPGSKKPRGGGLEVAQFRDDFQNVLDNSLEDDIPSNILEIVNVYNDKYEYHIEDYAKITGLKNRQISRVAKYICETICYMDLTEDDPLLSGIIDFRHIPEQLKAHLIERDDNARIPETAYDNSKEKDMFRAIRTLLHRLSTTRRREDNDPIHESTWNHQIINPIVEFLTHDIELLNYQWDTGKVISSYRNLFKKDYQHIVDDRIRLMKLAKTSMTIYLNYKNEFDDSSFQSEISQFILQAHDSTPTPSLCRVLTRHSKEALVEVESDSSKNQIIERAVQKDGLVSINSQER
ncbi:11638_t:CDS:10, partial [Ambispora gerdemannii]